MSSEGKIIILCTIGPLLSFIAAPLPPSSKFTTTVAVPTMPVASPFYYDPYNHDEEDSCERTPLPNREGLANTPASKHKTATAPLVPTKSVQQYHMTPKAASLSQSENLRVMFSDSDLFMHMQISTYAESRSGTTHPDIAKVREEQREPMRECMTAAAPHELRNGVRLVAVMQTSKTTREQHICSQHIVTRRAFPVRGSIYVHACTGMPSARCSLGGRPVAGTVRASPPAAGQLLYILPAGGSQSGRRAMVELRDTQPGPLRPQSSENKRGLLRIVHAAPQHGFSAEFIRLTAFRSHSYISGSSS
ncbi:hypothetical protein PSPO01_02889 [Paraphaeosphaeria sporulosa]